MHTPTMTPALSLLASDLWTIADADDARDNDLRAFGAPSECFGSTHSASAHRALVAIHDRGFASVAAATRALVERCSARWLHFSPLGAALDAAASVEENAPPRRTLVAVW